ncbi:MAG TPA: LacI family DNA-binding transcriptional regulator [Halanaerobiales bacterium]|nr:LacI family DNA-binding transcriptional regulator [Halanaerobiales bacterium]HPZ63115.1 LacI family DNA-binding transcriptional regulator [Halanaerobiales bacterium]HQD04648.1 LacI family DNA-binding transcriptional regulator [Halanaerobiales bacterium]
MKVTIKDIAREAGVSVTTVSRVLNNKVDVSPKTRQKVLDIINKLNYNPNSIARGLVMNKTYTIGLIVPDISNSFFAEIAKAIEEEIRSYGYSIIFCNTGNDKKRERESINLLKSKQVDGLIGAFSNASKEEIIALNKSGFPVVQIDRLVEDSQVPSVVVDNTVSGYLATEYLIKKGHKRIAHISGSLDTNTGIRRAAGYKKAMLENGLVVEEDLIIEGDFSQESGYQAMMQIMEENKDLTAVFAGNDMMALGAYRAIYDLGLKIPEDISIIGHDDFTLASLVRPALTTMQQPIYEIGELAARVLIDMLKGRKNKEPLIVVNTRLVERSSVKTIH